MVSFNAEGKNYEDLECGSCAGVKPEMQVILNTRAGDGRNCGCDLRNAGDLTTMTYKHLFISNSINCLIDV